MTIILGVEHGGKVYMGADSILVSGWDRHITADPKVFRAGSFLFGCTGSVRQNQILKYHLDVRPRKADESDEAYIVAGLIQAVRLAYKEQGFTTLDDGQETGAGFMVGYAGKIWMIENTFAATRYAGENQAIGIGASQALVALHSLRGHATRHQTKDVCDIPGLMIEAMETTSRFCSGIAAPFYVEVLDDEKEASGSDGLRQFSGSDGSRSSAQVNGRNYQSDPLHDT